MLSLFVLFFAELSGSQQPVVGVYHTVRSAAFDGVDVLAGPTVNVLPMRLPGQDGVSIRDAARELQTEMGRRTAHEQTRLRDVVSWTLGEGRGAIFNVWLNLLWHGDKIRTIRKGSESLLESFSVRAWLTYLDARCVADRERIPGRTADGLHFCEAVRGAEVVRGCDGYVVFAQGVLHLF